MWLTRVKEQGLGRWHQHPIISIVDSTNLSFINDCLQKPEWLRITGKFTQSVSKFPILLKSCKENKSPLTPLWFQNQDQDFVNKDAERQVHWPINWFDLQTLLYLQAIVGSWSQQPQWRSTTQPVLQWEEPAEPARPWKPSEILIRRVSKGRKIVAHFTGTFPGIWEAVP